MYMNVDKIILRLYLRKTLIQKYRQKQFWLATCFATLRPRYVSTPRACCLLCKCRTRPSLLDVETGQPGMGKTRSTSNVCGAACSGVVGLMLSAYISRKKRNSV